MSRKLVIKQLRQSDLSFFQAHLRRNPKVKQKGFNLDQKYIEGRFFPSLAAIAESRSRRQIPVQLTILGPGAAAAHTLMRKILKQEKNWRLNGEVIYDPDDQHGRYDLVRPDDFALMEFMGIAEPDAVKIVLLSSTHVADAALYRMIASRFPTNSMWELSEQELEQIIQDASPDVDHPIRDWLDASMIEDVGLGGGDSARRIARRPHGRGVSLQELRDARAAAEMTGRLGEELLHHHLEVSPWPGVVGYRWVSSENAVSLFDFELEMASGGCRSVDAKSTSGNFNNPIHMSIGELDEAANGGRPYDIVRLFEVREGRGMYRVAEDIGVRCRAVLDVLTGLPPGVSADSVSFPPTYFEFGAEEHLIEIPAEEP